MTGIAVLGILDSREASPSSLPTGWDDATRAIDAALDRLHFLAVAIRKASAKTLEQTVGTFLTDDDTIFRRDAAILLRRRFPAARTALCQQLCDSIAVRRRLLLQSNRHAKKLTVRRVAETETLDSQPSPNWQTPPPRPTSSHAPKKTPSRLLTFPSGITKASRPDSKAAVQLRRALHAPAPRVLSTTMSTISTTQADHMEYPPPPKAKGGETRIQCQYCLTPLDYRALREKGTAYWTSHVDQDLKPYTCLFPECADAMLLFTRRHEWKLHMEQIHSKDWLRKVHTTVWFCDLEHDAPQQFDTEKLWREHMEDLDAHEKSRRSRTKPTKAQLDALSSRKRQVALREYHVCPLCEQIPDKIRPIAQDPRADPGATYELLVDHVASHIKSLSLMSLPVLEISPPATPTGSIVEQESSGRRLLDNSLPRAPSGVADMDELSLPPDVWSTLDHETIAALTSQPMGTHWDVDVPATGDYQNPVEVPDALNFEWLESWRAWQQEHFPSALESVGPDPVIARFEKQDQDMMSLSSSTYKKKGRPELHIATSGLMDDGAWNKHP